VHRLGTEYENRRWEFDGFSSDVSNYEIDDGGLIGTQLLAWHEEFKPDGQTSRMAWTGGAWKRTTSPWRPLLLCRRIYSLLVLGRTDKKYT